MFEHDVTTTGTAVSVVPVQFFFQRECDRNVVCFLFVCLF